jgi:hypothetical protein
MTIKQQLSDALDQALLDCIKNGQVVTDENGNPVKISPSAKMLEVAIKRLSQLGLTCEITSTGRQAEIIRELREKGMRFRALPPISEGEERDSENRITA